MNDCRLTSEGWSETDLWSIGNKIQLYTKSVQDVPENTMSH